MVPNTHYEMMQNIHLKFIKAVKELKDETMAAYEEECDFSNLTSSLKELKNLLQVFLETRLNDEMPVLKQPELPFKQHDLRVISEQDHLREIHLLKKKMRMVAERNLNLKHKLETKELRKEIKVVKDDTEIKRLKEELSKKKEIVIEKEKIIDRVVRVEKIDLELDCEIQIPYEPRKLHCDLIANYRVSKIC